MVELPISKNHAVKSPAAAVFVIQYAEVCNMIHIFPHNVLMIITPNSSQVKILYFLQLYNILHCEGATLCYIFILLIIASQTRIDRIHFRLKIKYSEVRLQK